MDIEDKVQDIIDKSGGNSGGGGPDFSWKLVASIAGGLVLIMFLASCWVQIGTNSQGVVLRFGEKVRTLNPGLHFKWPMGIERVIKVETAAQQKVEFGFRSDKRGKRKVDEESLMLTGDLNVVDVTWTVQYRIADPEKYLFEVRNPRDTLRYMTQAVMREIIGDRTVSEVLTVGRTEVAGQVQEKLQNLCEDYDIGIQIDQVIPQDITPPDKVQPSFNKVNEAQQVKERLINQAKAERNKELPKARGEADRKIQQAEGYAINRVNEAKGEIARFNHLYKEYKRAPEVTKRRIFIETLGKVLPKIKRKVIVGKDTAKVIPLLPGGNMGELMSTE